MLMMAIPDVEIFMVFACLQYGFNLFAIWYQHLWFSRWGVCGIGFMQWVDSCKIVFLLSRGHFLPYCNASSCMIGYSVHNRQCVFD